MCLLTFYFVFHFHSRCPGRHFADQSVWLAAATLVATIDISKTRDSQGNEITPEATFVNGFVRYVLLSPSVNSTNDFFDSHPTEFPCIMRPRSAKISKIIDQSLADILKTELKYVSSH